MLETLDNGKPLAIAKAADVTLAAAISSTTCRAGPTKIEGNTVPISALTAPGRSSSRPHAQGAGRGRRPDHPVELPAADGGVEARARPGGRRYRGAEARRADRRCRRCASASSCRRPGCRRVVNIVTGFGDAGAALAANDAVDKVAFTGSTEVGRKIVQAAAGNLRRSRSSPGGKSPQVLYKDADLEVSIPGAANGIFFNQGQCCNAGSRLYIEKDVFDEVVSGITDEAGKITVGPRHRRRHPDGAAHLRGASARLHVLRRRRRRAWAAGGRWATTGTSSSRPCSPTTPDMKVVREEIFGPVVCAIPFSSEEDVVDTGNETSFGLAAGSGRATSTRRTGPRTACAPARCGSTATACSTPRCRSAATRSRAGAARWSTTRSTTTSRRSRSSSPSSASEPTGSDLAEPPPLRTAGAAPAVARLRPVGPVPAGLSLPVSSPRPSRAAGRGSPGSRR